MILRFAGLIFKLCGWKFHNEIPDSLRSFVLIGAPHTSNFDIIPALGVCYHSRRNTKFVIKSEWMRFPFNLVLGPAGALALNRSKLVDKDRVSTITLMAQEFERHHELVMMIAPEGTRQPREVWKTGWYYIALEAQVPVVMGFLDHRTKTAGLGPVLALSGDIKADLEMVSQFYAQFEACRTENFRLPVSPPDERVRK